MTDNGPDGKVMERGGPDRPGREVSPLKRILLRTIPALAPKLESVVNVFDPWARVRAGPGAVEFEGVWGFGDAATGGGVWTGARVGQ